jgi:hypothetical protein
MAAFHTWMVTRYPDQFQLAEDDDKDFEAGHIEIPFVCSRTQGAMSKRFCSTP